MYGIKLWVADDANKFYAWKMQVHPGKDGIREKKEGFQVWKDMVSPVWNWKRCYCW